MQGLPDNLVHGKPCRTCEGTVRYRAGHKCVSCRQKYWRDLSKDHPRNELHRKLGLTREKYFAALEDQDWACAICGKVPQRIKLDVDHCHKTMKFRGMLCKGCNTALGKFGDSPELLQRAAKYLINGGFGHDF